jgi:hypothetical protein
MGGRYYIPSIGRFTSPDPFVQSPTNLQSLNRYSYVLNNPINLNDPSGFWSIRKPLDFSNERRAVSRAVNNVGRELGRAGQDYIDIHKNIYNEGDRFVNKHGKQIVIIAAAAAITYASGGSMSGFGLALLKGAAVGAGMSAGMTVYHGGNFQDVLNASYSGAINGAASGALFNGVGDAFANTNTSFGSSGYFAKVGAHGAAGGITSEAGGGTFQDGFLSASISQALTPANERIFGTVTENPENKFARIAFSGSVGGLAAHASGGNVFMGTTTAIYGRWFNDENHGRPAFRQGNPNERPMSKYELDNYRELQFERGYSQGVLEAIQYAKDRIWPILQLGIGRGARGGSMIRQMHFNNENQNTMY